MCAMSMYDVPNIVVCACRYEWESADDLYHTTHSFFKLPCLGGVDASCMCSITKSLSGLSHKVAPASKRNLSVDYLMVKVVAPASKRNLSVVISCVHAMPWCLVGGSPFTKEYIRYVDSGHLRSPMHYFRAIYEINEVGGYWNSNRQRIYNQFVRLGVVASGHTECLF